MATKYLVLSTNAEKIKHVDYHKRASYLAEPHSWRAIKKSVEGNGNEREYEPASVSIKTIDGHETDAEELRANPKNFAVMDAEAIFSLIPPKARNASDAISLKTAGTLRMPEGLLAVNADTSPFTGQGVTIAVLDTGIDADHPAFKGKKLARRDFTGEGSSLDDVTDVEGHGTHVAGTACGAVVDDVRIGVAPGVTKLCIGKVIGAKGGTLEMLLKGIYWAIMDENASVVSMSLGYDLPGNTERLIQSGMNPALATQQAMRLQNDIIKGIASLRVFLESQRKNVLFVAASGNESERPAFVLDAGLPAAELFSVGAVGLKAGKWEVASFSNARAQLVAPGVDIVSAAVGGGWATMSGTSMATPHVAGVAALWVEKLRSTGEMTIPGSLYSVMMANATKHPLANTDAGSIGAGMVQAPMSI
ncbi:S8 family serine peptidase [Desulfobulbus sp. F3]|nr:S8 family serine peptidase [Desulfobulbus sp. F3]